jgi:phenylalanyl-tRNA synthetase beta chain
VTVDGTAIGYVGEVDPEISSAWGIDGRVNWCEVDLEALLAGARRSDLAAPVSRYPSTDIDLAFVVADEVPAAAVEATLAHTGGGLLERLTLFDVYRGEGVADGHRSLAFRLRLCAFDRTLTDSEVGALRAECIAAAERHHGARLRG